MAASATATIKSTYYHPQHMLASYHYSDASTYTCAACERVVTGAGYGCGECGGFHIHKACFTGLPGSFSMSRSHSFRLTRLDASRPCVICKESSHAGRYMYLCAAFGFYVHPRCVVVTSSYFHTQHCLAVHDYDDEEPSRSSCAACERAITGGTGYRCGECGFDIHEACFRTMPVSVSLAKHHRHELGLTRLAASRRCDACKEASDAGRYMYLCAPCNYGVHPRCVPADRDDGARRGRAAETYKEN
ncbi:unnamed protein product [Urochloa decumbens]|uniref:Phorbol-ester/DAG-type domain-containing protein n=1 Tax=Urochloa decumbens TaxID=240449 RepID=A0ABC9G0A3_9POAL